MGVVDHGERATAPRQLPGSVRGHVAVTWRSGEDVGEGGHQRLAGDEGLVEHAREGEHRQPAVRDVGSHSDGEERTAVAACRSPRHMGRCGRVRARLPLRSSAISSRSRASLFSPNLRGSKPRSPGFRDLSANIVFMSYAPQFDQISMSETKTRICAAKRRVSGARAERRAGPIARRSAEEAGGRGAGVRLRQALLGDGGECLDRVGRVSRVVRERRVLLHDVPRRRTADEARQSERGGSGGVGAARAASARARGGGAGRRGRTACRYARASAPPHAAS